jgi:hypothetical protein
MGTHWLEEGHRRCRIEMRRLHPRRLMSPPQEELSSPLVGGAVVGGVAVGRRCHRRRLPVLLLNLLTAAPSPPACIPTQPADLLHHPRSLAFLCPPARRGDRRGGFIPRLERRCFVPWPKCEQRGGLGRYWTSGGV